jgi:triosephosphate isomerase
MLVINFKNYKVGKDVFDLAKKIEIYYNKAILAVPATELHEIAKSMGGNAKVFAQHVDFQDTTRSTGFVLPESLVNSGADGTLLNHSEHRVKLPEIKKIMKRCNELNLKVIVCSSSLKEIEQLKKLNPYAIAFEDKKLIATGKSITEYRLHDVKKFIEKLKDTNIIPLCGAGISSGDDVAHALVLGCKGVLVSSVIANSQTPEKFLKEISGIL